MAKANSTAWHRETFDVMETLPSPFPPGVNCAPVIHQMGPYMSKGMDRKKEGKKKPAKTLEEKRAAKREKKANR